MKTSETVKFFFGEKTSGLRNTLKPEITNAADLLLRQTIRRISTQVGCSFDYFFYSSFTNAVLLCTQVEISAPQLPFLPSGGDLPVPFMTREGSPTIMSLEKATETLAPPLTQDEEIYALSMLDLATLLTGLDIKNIFIEPKMENIFGVVQSLVSLDLSSNPLSNTPVLSLIGSQNNDELQEFVLGVTQLDKDSQMRAESFVSECLQEIQSKIVGRL